MEKIVYNRFNFKNDTENVLNLYHKKYSTVVSFERNTDYIQSLIIYPGVSSDGVIVAEYKTEIVSFFIMAVVERDNVREGHVFEFIINPDYDYLSNEILQYIENYFLKQQVDVIISSPIGDNKCLSSSNDWILLKDRVFMSYPIDLRSVMKSVLIDTDPYEVMKILPITFVTENDCFVLVFKDKKIHVEDGNFSKDDAIIRSSTSILWELILHGGSVYSYIIRGKIKVSLMHFKRCITMLQLFTLPGNFYLTISDHY